MKMVCSIAGGIVTLVALTVLNSATFLFFYQPQTPKCLKK